MAQLAVPVVISSREPSTDSSSVPIGSSFSSPSPSVSDLDLPITFLKGTHHYTTLHPISHFVSYNSLSPRYSAFVSSLSSISLPKSIPKALSHPSGGLLWLKKCLSYIPLGLGTSSQG